MTYPNSPDAQNPYGQYKPPQWPPPAPAQTPPGGRSKPGKSRWFIPVGVGVGALIIGSALGSAGAGGPPKTKTITAAAEPATTVTATATQQVTSTVTATPPAPTATVTTTFTPQPVVAMSDGQFAIPAELQPGRYHTDGTGSCYWETSKDLSGSFGSIMANGNTSGPTTIDIPSSAGGFSSNGGCSWTKVG